jgi:hypothetical protein
MEVLMNESITNNLIYRYTPKMISSHDIPKLIIAAMEDVDNKYGNIHPVFKKNAVLTAVKNTISAVADADDKKIMMMIINEIGSELIDTYAMLSKGCYSINKRKKVKFCNLL